MQYVTTARYVSSFQSTLYVTTARFALSSCRVLVVGRVERVQYHVRWGGSPPEGQKLRRPQSVHKREPGGSRLHSATALQCLKIAKAIQETQAFGSTFKKSHLHHVRYIWWKKKVLKAQQCFLSLYFFLQILFIVRNYFKIYILLELQGNKTVNFFIETPIKRAKKCYRPLIELESI